MFYYWVEIQFAYLVDFAQYFFYGLLHILLFYSSSESYTSWNYFFHKYIYI